MCARLQNRVVLLCVGDTAMVVQTRSLCELALTSSLMLGEFGVGVWCVVCGVYKLELEDGAVVTVLELPSFRWGACWMLEMVPDRTRKPPSGSSGVKLSEVVQLWLYVGIWCIGYLVRRVVGGTRIRNRGFGGLDT